MKKFLLFFLWIPFLSHSFEFANDVKLEGGTQVLGTIDYRLSLLRAKNQVFFLSLKGGLSSSNHTLTPHSKSAFIEGNYGLGTRYETSFGTFGGYCLYGNIRTPYHLTFARVTAGVDYHGCSYLGFFNLYFPVQKNNKFIGHHFGFQKRFFQLSGHDLRFQTFNEKEFLSPLTFELGLGKCFSGCEAIIRGYFHMNDQHRKNRYGGKIELNKPDQKGVSLHTSLSYDTLYKTSFVVGIRVNFGWDRAGYANCKECCQRDDLLYRVYTEEFFWAGREKEKSSEKIANETIFFVDNARSYEGGFLGDGTFEFPFVNASLANSAISSLPDAIVYFYQGNAFYTDFGTFNLFSSQMITGEGGNWFVDGELILPGSNVTRPILAKTPLQEAFNTPLITVTNGGKNRIENIALANVSLNTATGNSMITNVGSSIESLILKNVTSTDKVTLFFSEGDQTIHLFDNDIYGVDIKTFQNASLNLQVKKNVFRTNSMIAQRFFQPIGCSLFMEALDNSSYIVSSIYDNTCFNTRLNLNNHSNLGDPINPINGNSHLGFGFLSSTTSFQAAPNGFLKNTSIGGFGLPTAGAFLFQGVDSSRVQINGCFGNASSPLSDGFTLQLCDVNIKRPGVPGNAAGLSFVNNNSIVAVFASVNIFNNP